MYDPLQCVIAGHTQENCSSKRLTYYHWRKKIVSGLELKDFTAPPQTPLRCTLCTYDCSNRIATGMGCSHKTVVSQNMTLLPSFEKWMHLLVHSLPGYIPELNRKLVGCQVCIFEPVTRSTKKPPQPWAKCTYSQLGKEDKKTTSPYEVSISWRFTMSPM
jgi:hypothetical protein